MSFEPVCREQEEEALQQDLHQRDSGGTKQYYDKTPVKKDKPEENPPPGMLNQIPSSAPHPQQGGLTIEE